MTTIDLLAAETHVDSPFPPIVWGGGLLLIFLLLLFIVLAIGKGRPHA
ncbi:MAG TPA: hypothetical protein VFZ72_02830 [Jiangellaceae bacterium]